MDKSKIGKRFQGKVAIITASTQGIGFAIAQRIGLEGASIVISSRKQKNVDEAAEKLRDQGIEVLALACHVSNAQQRKNLIDKTVQKYGKIDVIVSNAAANPSVDNLLQTPESILDKLWEINVKASIILLKVVVAYLLAMEHANNLSISPIENIDYDQVEGSFNSLDIIGKLQSAKRLQEFFFTSGDNEAEIILSNDEKIALLGAIQSFFEGSMYAFAMKSEK